MPNGKDPKPKLGAERGTLAKIGNMEELQVALWEVISKIKGELVGRRAIIRPLPLKAAHTLATLAGVYVRLHEVADLEPRLSEIEKSLADKR